MKRIENVDPDPSIELRSFEDPHVLSSKVSVFQQILGTLLSLSFVVLSHKVGKLH